MVGCGNEDENEGDGVENLTGGTFDEEKCGNETWQRLGQGKGIEMGIEMGKNENYATKRGSGMDMKISGKVGETI